MRWDRFFEDLETQLDSEWEAERAALDSESERLRLAKLPLRERLVAAVGADAGADLVGAESVSGRVSAVGADWCALDGANAHATLVPLGAIVALTLTHESLLRSARAASAGSMLSQRMTFGFVARDLVRKRVPVAIVLTSGRTLTGTIDRAGADHLDVALHDVDAPRRGDAVNGHRMIPFAAIAAVRLGAPVAL
ncbi:hypothetical protein [Microbacterium sp. No. 7]|uniref:hypothetical protein n=1 Tax=Microbacterium sp. No. 7 TaxID=1714373 RepID=UPI0006D1D5E6|nr:hypothetical protein [Microbacterium sp. No. 7]ALJ21266.1 hypothetical protein AOA12_15700 [Microbacterium sp. No. 7]